MDLCTQLLLAAAAQLGARPEFQAAVVYQHPATTITYSMNTTLLPPSSDLQPYLELNDSTRLKFTAAFAALHLNHSYNLIFNQGYGLVIIRRLV